MNRFKVYFLINLVIVPPHWNNIMWNILNLSLIYVWFISGHPSTWKINSTMLKAIHVSHEWSMLSLVSCFVTLIRLIKLMTQLVISGKLNASILKLLIYILLHCYSNFIFINYTANDRRVSCQSFSHLYCTNIWYFK